MSRFASLTLPALIVIGFTATAPHAPADEPGVKRDLTFHEPGPAPELPPAGQTFADPVFGSTILRVTDERDGHHSHVAYSYWPTFNRDATYFHISVAGQGTLYAFDPDELTLGEKRPLFPGTTPAGTMPRWEDATWSATDPEVIFAHDMRRLWAFNVQTRQYTLLKDFGGHIAQMSRSLDDNVFAFHGNREDGKVYVVWQREPERVVLENELPSVDEVQLDKTGRYLLIKTGVQGRGRVEVQVADLRTGRITDLTDDEPDYAPGHSDSGHDSVVGADNWRNQITGRRLSDPHEHFTVLDLKNDWTQGLHVSFLNDDERWIVINFYSNEPIERALQGEIIQVATDGSQRVRRLAHHHSVTGGEYWKIPLANVSRDGRLIAFTSNFGNAEQTDVFILQVPPMSEADDDAGKDHPLIRTSETDSR